MNADRTQAGDEEERRQDLVSSARFADRAAGDPDQIRAFALDLAQSLVDDKCEDLVILDVRELSQVTDYILIGSGTSDRQMRSALGKAEELAEARGYPPYRKHADERATWLLADFIDVVVHLFEPNTRAHYDIEMLWGDAPRLEAPTRPSPRAPGAPGDRV